MNIGVCKDDAPRRFSIFALRFLRVLLNLYIRITFGILSLKIKVLYELVLFGFATSEKLSCSGISGILLKAVCLWGF